MPVTPRRPSIQVEGRTIGTSFTPDTSEIAMLGSLRSSVKFARIYQSNLWFVQKACRDAVQEKICRACAAKREFDWRLQSGEEQLMKRLQTGVAVLVGLAILSCRSSAQDCCPTNPTTGSAVSMRSAGSGFTPSSSGSTMSPGQGQPPPYSYYVSASAPARTYVPYGPGDQFFFTGQPYGSPNDRWSWYYMGGGTRYLARYYYPPLR